MAEKIGEIREKFKSCRQEELGGLIACYREDSRAGVRSLVESALKRVQALEAERSRLQKMRFYEDQYREYGLICGIDEVGRGPLAGPVVAGAVILPADCEILYLNDSKKLSPAKREELYEVICREAVGIGLGFVGPERIDEINILQNDAVTIPGMGIRQVPIIKGDAKSVSIAAASIVAKVTRDRLMEEYEKVYPGYGFAANKGYGAASHIEALKKYGPTPIHRRSFLTHFI